MSNPVIAREVDWVAEVRVRNAIAHAIRQIDAEANPQNLEQKPMVTMVTCLDHSAGADPIGSPQKH